MNFVLFQQHPTGFKRSEEQDYLTQPKLSDNKWTVYRLSSELIAIILLS